MLLSPLDHMRLQRGAAHLHALGPCALAEYLAEVASAIGGGPCIIGRLTEYERRLTPAMVRRAGGDRFPPRALREVAS